jgi:hypothetical protein
MHGGSAHGCHLIRFEGLRVRVEASASKAEKTKEETVIPSWPTVSRLGEIDGSTLSPLLA